jgi:hypothetical protein
MKGAESDIIITAFDAIKASAKIDFKQQKDGSTCMYAEGTSYKLNLIVRSSIDRVNALGSLKLCLEQCGNNTILITSHLSNGLIEKCQELGIQFIDTAGNAYISLPGVRIFISGRKLSSPFKIPKGNNAASLKVHFAILSHPGLIAKPLRQIAKVANCSLAVVHGAIQDLTNRKLLSIKNAGQKRTLIQPTRLFEEWTTNYPIVLKPRLKVKRFHCENPDWWKQAKLKNAWWGSEVAASIMTNHLQPATQSIYTLQADFDSVIKSLAISNRWQADAQGEIEVLSTFFEEVPQNLRWHNCISPIIVYADLVSSLDSRNLETAKVLFEKVIKNEIATH